MQKQHILACCKESRSCETEHAGEPFARVNRIEQQAFGSCSQCDRFASRHSFSAFRTIGRLLRLNEDLIEAVQKGNKALQGFDCSCFDGNYITKDVDEKYLQHLERLRSDVSKHQREHADNLAGIDLYSSQ